MNEQRPWKRQLLTLLAVALVVRVVWMVALPRAAISVDLKDWRIAAATMLQGTNPYVEYDVLNWPPFWMEVLFVLGRVCDRMDWDFLVCMRLTLIGVELAVMAVTFGLIGLLDRKRSAFGVVLIGMALNPLLVLLTVVLANFDAVAVFWVLLALWALVRFRREGNCVDWLLACGCLGMGVFTKTFPMVLTPLLASGVSRMNWRTRVLGAALVLGPAVLSLAPLYVLFPDDISAKVIHYRSIPGTFGISGLLIWAGHGAATAPYATLFSWAVLIVLALMAVLLYHRQPAADADLVLLAGLMLMSLFTLGPGYGPQYWFWVIPPLVASYPFQRRSLRVVLIAGLIVAVATNLVLDAFGRNYGRFAYNWNPQKFGEIYRWFERANAQTEVNLPLFVASLVVVAWGWCAVIGRGRWKAA